MVEDGGTLKTHTHKLRPAVIGQIIDLDLYGLLIK